MPSKQVVAIIAVGVFVALLTITSILSVANGRLNQRVKTLQVRVARLENQSRGGASVDKFSRLDRRVDELSRQVHNTVQTANRNATRYNQLIGAVRTLAVKAQSGGQRGLSAALRDVVRTSKILRQSMDLVPQGG